MKDQLLHEIIEEISEKGDYFVPLKSLEAAFGCEHTHIICIKERLLIWAVENQIVYEYREVNHATVVRFFMKGKDT